MRRLSSGSSTCFDHDDAAEGVPKIVPSETTYACTFVFSEAQLCSVPGVLWNSDRTVRSQASIAGSDSGITAEAGRLDFEMLDLSSNSDPCGMEDRRGIDLLSESQV
jgi:hypothetical protein